MPASRFALSVLSGLLLTLLGVVPAAAWEHLGDARDPALWTTGDAWLVNPDPSADPRLRRGMAAISLQCRGGKPDAFLNHNFEVAAGKARVTLQLDEGPIAEEVWTSDADDIVIRPPDPRLLVARLLGHRRLRLGVTWPGAAPTATTFAVTDLDRAMLPLRARCAW